MEARIEGTINVTKFMKAFNQGALKVIQEKDHLNAINVFPVADSDTGSNLASLMQTILDDPLEIGSSLSDLLTKIAENSLMGARGNSGIIFAQYLNGLAVHFLKSKSKDLADFVASLKEATAEAYKAVETPKEGTIITLMRIWGQTVYDHFQQESSLEQALLNARKEAWTGLAATQQQLDVLRKNQLVDAGAKGFYTFLDGFTSSYAEGKEEKVIASEKKIHFEEAVEHAFTSAPEQRYCTELFMKEVKSSAETIREQLSDLGESLIVAKGTNTVRIHIHTNNPLAVVEKLEPFGQVVQQKADDMLLQYQLANQKKNSMVIVTDSIADLPADYLLKEQIYVLPMNVLIDGSNYLDKLTINGEQLLSKKAQTQDRISTAQPTAKSVDNVLSFLEKKYEAVLFITVSSSLSGTYQLIKKRIEQRYGAQNKIQVLDSKVNSAAQGLLVQEAKELVNQGYDINQVVEILEQRIENTFIYVAVGDLDPMIQSGRIPQRIGRLAKKMNIYPIVQLDRAGNGKLSGISFSKAGCKKKIWNKIRKLDQLQGIKKLGIVHTNNLKEAKEWNLLAEKITGKEAEFIEEGSSVIMLSAGEKSIAVAGIMEG